VIADVAVVAAGYLAGSLPFGYWIVRLLRHADIRTLGSKNTGATNVWRSFGSRLGIATLLLDLAKGAVPALAGVLVGGSSVGVLAGAAAVLGHSFPLLLGFGGGKGVATGAGVLLAVAPVCFGAAVGVFAVALVVGRFVSLASILGAVACFVTAIATGQPGPVLAFCGIVGGFVILRHRANIGRLLARTEPRIRLRKSA
jgi:acyl phosphate:glycerol-3-phosphate acyltransferase